MTIADRIAAQSKPTSFLDFTEAIVGYAADIDDLECVIDPALNVEHYQALLGSSKPT